MPRRVQIHPITRRHPEGSTFVGDNSKWATPFKVVCEEGKWLVLDENNCAYEPWINSQAAAEIKAVELYRTFVIGQEVTHEEICAELAGSDLACTCEPGRPCHADALLYVARGGQP